MREIKFRQWDSRRKRMYYGIGVTGPGSWSGFPYVTWEHYPIIQYTGLCDRNGKEVFEGDIIKIESSSYGTYSVPIEYLPGRCMFGGATWGDKAVQIKMPDRKWGKKHKPYECDGAMYEAMGALDTVHVFVEKNERVEVIGNIYENPELLK